MSTSYRPTLVSPRDVDPSGLPMHVGIDSHSAEREGEGNSTYCRGLVSALVDDSGGADFTLFTADSAHVFYMRELQLVIAGKPDFGAQPVLARARHLGQDGTVRWVGLLPEEDLSAFYTGAAAFVYPSLFEGFGLPILEAMACGAPVVASNRAAMPELLGDAGLLVDPEDVQTMADSIGRIMNDHALAGELSQRGLARSRQYSWAATARRTLAVYHGAAGR